MNLSDGLLFSRYRLQDLSNTVLKPDEKKWIANNIIDESSTAIKSAQKYNLKSKTIQNWVNRTTKGVPLYESGGRPPYIPTSEKDNLILLIAEKGIDINIITDQQLIGCCVEIKKRINPLWTSERNATRFSERLKRKLN